MQDATVLLSESDRKKYGISRSMWYRLLNREDLPVVKIGGRKFLHRDLFERWLAEQAKKPA